jgi:hypothetical protein
MAGGSGNARWWWWVGRWVDGGLEDTTTSRRELNGDGAAWVVGLGQGNCMQTTWQVICSGYQLYSCY